MPEHTGTFYGPARGNSVQIWALQQKAILKRPCGTSWLGPLGGSRDGEKRSLAEAEAESTHLLLTVTEAGRKLPFIFMMALALLSALLLFFIFIITPEGENLVTIIHGKIESVAGG